MFILSATLFFMIDFLLNDISPLYCIDEETERKLETVKDINVKPNVSNVNVQNPDLDIHNPNIQIPSSIVTSKGIDGTVSAGIYALAQSKKVAAMAVGAKAATVALGGILGVGAFVAANYFNTKAQNSLKNSNDGPNKATKYNPYCDVSYIIEDGGSVENINYIWFYWNFNKDITSIYDLLGNFNKQFKETLMQSKNQLSDLINNFKNRQLNVKFKIKILKQKNIFYYQCLNELSTDFITSIFLEKGKLL